MNLSQTLWRDNLLRAGNVSPAAADRIVEYFAVPYYLVHVPWQSVMQVVPVTLNEAIYARVNTQAWLRLPPGLTFPDAGWLEDDLPPQFLSMVIMTAMLVGTPVIYSESGTRPSALGPVQQNRLLRATYIYFLYPTMPEAQVAMNLTRQLCDRDAEMVTLARGPKGTEIHQARIRAIRNSMRLLLGPMASLEKTELELPFSI